ncbi:MAG: DUF262 domain-containing protein [Candidatus Treponema excrementipullorum]|nr:DUF262 domain-containing protein [Candidatus Treponema excrementipullorum]
MKIWDSENGRSTKQKLDTITVWELMNNKFYIPDYQRGYRWSSFEVKKLLEDLSEYINNDKTGQSFYCMQPLVVFYKEEKGAWEVIDGQQRLTTLYLILYQKRKRLKEDNPDMELFSLSYKSRPGSEKFLEEINFNQREENIDYYHICNALDEIEIYFGKINSGKYVDYILNAKDEKGNPSVKFIWYDVTEEIAKGKISSEEIFSRLNVGKIGLTNAELIKALFLNRVDKEVKNYDEKFKERISFSLKTKISKDWDMIEHGLQKNDFWSFIYGKEDYKYDTRIEFLFDVIKDKTVTQRDIEYYTFDKYVEDFKKYDEYEKKIKDATDEQSRDIIRKEMSSYSVERKWDELMKKYYLFRNWYEDRYLYHLIGYLRYKEISIKDIISLEDTIETHSEFIEKLRKWCVALALNVESSGIEDFYNNKSSTEVKDFIATTLQTFNYGTTPNKIIYDTLLLFNVLTALDCKKMNVKFLFNEFYDTKSWDLEHIRSQTPKTTDGNDRQDWILTNLGYFSGVAFPFELRHEEKTRTDQVKGFIEKIKEQFPKLEKEIAIQPRGTQEGKSAKYVCEKLISLLNSSESITETPIYKELSSQFINEENAPLQAVENIHNLVLLDSATNRSYKNAFYPVKRRWLNAREKEGIYILPCTKNVFSKTYSTKLFDLMNWTDSDADAYIKEMVECLSNT